MSNNRKYKTIIRPFNKSAFAEIKQYFRIFHYKPTVKTTVKLRDENGNLIRDENDVFNRAIRETVPPYFTLYLFGNLNKRTVQSIAARINRNHRRIARINRKYRRTAS